MTKEVEEAYERYKQARAKELEAKLELEQCLATMEEALGLVAHFLEQARPDRGLDKTPRVVV